MPRLDELALVLIWWNGLCVEELARPKNVAKDDWRNVPLATYLDAAATNMAEANDALRDGDTGTFIGRCTDACNLLMLASAVRSNEAKHTEF